MFTGIITDIGTIRSADQRGDLRLTIGCDYDMNGVAIGASIACSGACLTVVDKGALDCVIRARMQAAILRGTASNEIAWEKL